MSKKLRDTIRREAYITNEIIIQQEAQRAVNLSPCRIVPVAKKHVSQNKSEKSDDWERVLRSSLSQFDFDLEVHGSPMSPNNDSKA